MRFPFVELSTLNNESYQDSSWEVTLSVTDKVNKESFVELPALISESYQDSFWEVTLSLTQQ